MMRPGSAGFCTLLLCSSPVVSIPSPPKHPLRPLFRVFPSLLNPEKRRNPPVYGLFRYI